MGLFSFDSTMHVPLFLIIMCLSPMDAGETLCLSCKDVASPLECHTVTKCGHYDECYVELYANSLGALRYDLGCKDAQFCGKLSSGPHLGGRQTGHIHVCTECCNGTVCNSAGCGKMGLPPPTLRGSLCFACDTQYRLDDCSEFKQCNREEVCVLQEDQSQITGELVYNTGCMQASKCATIYQRLQSIYAVIGKRNIDNTVRLGSECKIECCDSDFCNRGCNATNQNVNTAVTSPKTQPQTVTKSPLTTTKRTTVAITTTSGTTRQWPQTTQTVPISSATPRPTTTPIWITSSTNIRTTTTQIPTTSSTTHRSTSRQGYPTTSANRGCSDSLPHCSSTSFLDSICHLTAEKHHCAKGCGLCRTLAG